MLLKTKILFYELQAQNYNKISFKTTMLIMLVFLLGVGN